jgi:hypothetical protein
MTVPAIQGEAAVWPAHRQREIYLYYGNEKAPAAAMPRQLTPTRR